MWRVALRPKWAALLVLVLAVVTLFVWAGNWQWNRAQQNSSAEQSSSAPPRDLATVLQPQQRINAAATDGRVRASGIWEPADTVLVSGRTHDGRTGVWIVAPLLVEDARLPVVLGFTPQPPRQLPQLPSGPVQVVGHLRQGQSPGGVDHRTASPSGVTVYRSLSTAELVNAWQSPMYSAYLIGVEPATLDADLPAGTELMAVRPAPENAGLAWRNLSYALQWFLFAGFAVVLWYRMVRDAYVDEQAQAG
ncbi:MAG: hypothetical protein CSA58_01955 [Micrococcales bacterium]|nr:MAG: hypothetical protein CSB46_05440 [Micrococcales bacterium]PIE27875.1 MAG: hypothetical protein CSA58_01955 [Micrococcales bacterium]